MKTEARGLAITLDVEGRRVVVVGGGEEAERKVELLLEAGAQVALVAELVIPELEALERAGRLTREARPFRPQDLDGALLVMVTVRDRALAAAVHAAAAERRLLCWSTDDPTSSNLAMPAVARLGAARIAVSTAGSSPALARLVRDAIARSLGEEFARFVNELGRLRRQAQLDEADTERRRARLLRALDGFTLELSARYPLWFHK